MRVKAGARSSFGDDRAVLPTGSEGASGAAFQQKSDLRLGCHRASLASSRLRVFASSRLRVFASSRLRVFASSRLRVFASSRLRVFASSPLRRGASRRPQISSRASTRRARQKFFPAPFPDCPPRPFPHPMPRLSPAMGLFPGPTAKPTGASPARRLGIRARSGGRRGCAVGGSSRGQRRSGVAHESLARRRR